MLWSHYPNVSVAVSCPGAYYEKLRFGAITKIRVLRSPDTENIMYSVLPRNTLWFGAIPTIWVLQSVCGSIL